MSHTQYKSDFYRS